MSREPGTAWRVAGVVVGTAAIGYGVLLLLERQDAGQVAHAAAWLAVGVLLHDAVLAPLTIVLGVLTARWAPPGLRMPATAVLVVLGPLTLLAIPVLGGFGEEPSNPSHLDRPYLAGWAVIVALVLAGSAAHALVVRSGSRAAGKETDGPGAGGR